MKANVSHHYFNRPMLKYSIWRYFCHLLWKKPVLNLHAMRAGWNPLNKEISSASDRIKLHTSLCSIQLLLWDSWYKGTSLGLPCLCIGLVTSSTAQTTFWPLCHIFSDIYVCVMSFPVSLKAARSCKVPHCLCFLLLWELLSQGLSGVKSPISQEDPLVCHAFICKVDHSNSLCHFSIGQDLTGGHWDPTALEAPDAVFYTVSFQVRTAL